jgi:CDP-glucose 4,6-dehydratase
LENLAIKFLTDNIFAGKTVLVTGHTGFVGSWLTIWLKELGAEVVGYALEAYSTEDNFEVTKLNKKIVSIIGDVQDFENLKRVFSEYRPEIVFHLAAQPLVRLSYRQPKLTYDTNIGGTVNLLECCRLTDAVRVIINVTSDKCYENKGRDWWYRETDPIGGYDPYSSSKGCAEIITSAYRNSFFSAGELSKNIVSISSVRAGNIIGGGDWQKDRIVPDCIKALLKNEPIGVRLPEAVRPWQYILEPLSGYLLLATKMAKFGDKYSGAWNFGPDSRSVVTVGELVKKIINHWGKGEFKDLSQESLSGPHEAKFLMLDITKARNWLNWEPTLSLDEAVEYTVNWYKQAAPNYDLCVNQIIDFMTKVIERQTQKRS